jgi:hypothetical protein
MPKTFIFNEGFLEQFVVSEANRIGGKIPEHRWIQQCVYHEHIIVNEPKLFPCFVEIQEILFNDINHEYTVVLKKDNETGESFVNP